MKDLEERREQLRALIAKEWEYELRESPEFATMIGDYRFNDRWSDLSLARVDEHRRDLTEWLARFDAIDTSGFPEQEELDHRLMVRALRESLEDIESKAHEMPVDQMDGYHLLLPQFVTYMPFDTVRHYEDYLCRLGSLPTVMEQLMELMRQGAKDRLMPPRFLLEKTAEQCRGIAEPAGVDNVYGRPVVEMPGAFGPADQERLTAEAVAAIDDHVRPAYRRLADFIAGEYAPQGRTEMGIWSLPDGDSRYRLAMRHLTTTERDPDEVHELGLREVARVEAEQEAIAKRLGHPDLAALRAALKTDRAFFATSPEQLVSEHKRYIDQMEAKLPDLFGLLPAIPLDVRPVEAYREKEASAAEYHSGTPDGSRPGVVYVNTGDCEQRSIVGIEAVAYHEGVPGHHLQVAIAETLSALPPFRQHAYYGAYTEGWALYAERLGKEIGFYEGEISDFGRLSNELLRAVRLVLDTGVHHRRWSREQMVDYFRAHSDEPEPELQAEVDRYVVLPAQALTYKLGELEILRLRERARTELGPRFDLRAFHDRLLDGGALPLDVLAERVETWIGAPLTILSGFEFPMEEELFFEEQGGALKRASMQEAARAALDRARLLVSPAIAYDWFPVSLVGKYEAQVGDAVFHLGHHADLLEPAREVFLALMTVGPRLEAESRAMQAAGKALDAYMLDAAGVFGVGLLIQRAHRIVEEEAARRGWGVGAELAPGQLSGWPLSDQISIGEMLGVDKMGVEVTASGILVPQKSASLMVGLGLDYESSEVHSPCEFCDVQDTCRFRH